MAVLPGLGLALHHAEGERQAAADRVVSEAWQLARTTASEQERLVDGAREIARSLAAMPAIRSERPAGCRQALSALVGGFDLVNNIMVVRPDGRVRCSALPLPGPVTLADRPAFQEAVTRRDTAVSDYVIGRVGGTPIVVVFHPLLEPAGEVRAVIAIALDLTWVNRLLARADLPPESRLTVVDRQGVILARRPDPERWVGKTLPEGVLREAVQRSSVGLFEALGVDGARRLFTVAPLRGVREARTGSVIVGLPEGAVYSAASEARNRSLAAVGLAGLAAALMAWAVGTVSIRRPIERLSRAAARIAAGEREVRLGPPYSRGELGRLARTFDETAAALEGREEDLLETRGTLQAVIDNAPLPIVVLDERDTVRLWNGAAERTFGWEAGEVLGGQLPVVPGAARAEQDRFRESVLGGESIHDVEVRRVKKDGSLLDLVLFASPLRDSRGAIRGGILTHLDITERKRLEAQHRLVLAALNAAANAVVITDRDGRISWTNTAFTALTGFSAEEALGQTPRLLRSATQDPAFYADLWQTILAGQVWHGELVNRRKDGGLYREQQTIAPVRDEQGEVTHFIAIKHDVTAQRRTEETLRQTEKLAAMGALLAGVAHELNNPLVVVRGHAQMLRQTAGAGPLADRAVKIDQAAARCARIVGNFLALARERPPERQEVQLNEVIREALELLAYPLRVATVEVKASLADDLPPLWADPHQLHQVVVNLASNARDAMRAAPPPRRLTLTTSHDEARNRLSLEVADTGPGMAPEVRQRLFEPFFTTKPVGQGTGLGLSICRGIVEAHGGSLEVESEPGRGARFVVALPVVTPQPGAGPGASAEAAAPAIQGKSILVVDDESEVADLLGEILSAAGHHVDTAANGQAALDRIRTRAYDLILSDLRMPELDGPGFYRELQRRDPQLCRRVVFMTGDTLGPNVTEFLDEAGRPHLSKPFTVQEVHRVVQEALAMQQPR